LTKLRDITCSGSPTGFFWDTLYVKVSVKKVQTNIFPEQIPNCEYSTFHFFVIWPLADV